MLVTPPSAEFMLEAWVGEAVSCGLCMAMVLNGLRVTDAGVCGHKFHFTRAGAFKESGSCFRFGVHIMIDA